MMEYQPHRFRDRRGRTTDRLDEASHLRYERLLQKLDQAKQNEKVLTEAVEDLIAAVLKEEIDYDEVTKMVRLLRSIAPLRVV